MTFVTARSKRRHHRLLIGPAAALGVVAAMLAAPGAALADTMTYYVDCSSATPGDGTSQAAPLTTLAAVNAQPLAAGDELLFKKGTTCAGQLLLRGDGAAGAPIVVGSWGSGAKPTIAGGGTANNTGAVQLLNGSYWTIQDLHVTNRTASANPSTYRSGVLVENTGVGRLAGITLQRLTVDSVRSNPGKGNARMYGGISALTFGTTKSGYDGLVIRANTVSDVSRTGIITSNAQYPKAYDANVRITGNTVRSIRGDGIVMIGAQHGRIDTNTVTGAGDLGSCPGCGRMGGPETASAGIWPSNTKSIRIDHNEVLKTHNTGGDGEGFDIDRNAVDTIVEYNYSHDNQGGGVLLTGARSSTIRFNIFENNGQGALTFYGKAPSTSTTFSNNTVYISKRTNANVVRTFGAIKGSKVSFKNNLVYNYGSGKYIWPTKSVTTSANTLVGNRGAGAPHDARTSRVDPGLRAAGTGGTGFVSAKGLTALRMKYSPKHPSSFKRGIAIPRSVTVDIFGKKVDYRKPPRGAAA
jgi:hypothetical protein